MKDSTAASLGHGVPWSAYQPIGGAGRAQSETPKTRALHLVHGDRDRRIRSHQAAVLALVALGLAFAVFAFGGVRNFVIVTCCIFAFLAFVMSVSFLITLMYGKREAGIEGDLKLPPPSGPARESIAVLIPARHETSVLAATLLNTAWTQQDHARHQIYTIINDDDPETIAVAALAATAINDGFADGMDRETIERDIAFRLGRGETEQLPVAELLAAVSAGPIQVVVYPLEGRPPNKPQQLNYAFWRLHDQFSVFTVLDAESLAAPGLLCTVDQAFGDRPEVAVIQGGIQLMDPAVSGPWWRRAFQSVRRWYSWHNLLEYTRWFSSQMRYQSDRGFMPLGGNTVFLRTELLAKTDGWPMSLTEDCELGVRATAVHGARTLSFYDPALTTREETPTSLSTLIKQRRRWNIGFIQSFVAGNWRALPTFRQRFVAVWILSMCFFQTVSLAILPLTLLTVFWIKSPAPLAVALCIPTIPIILGMALQMLYLREFGKNFGRRVEWHAYVIYVVTFFAYQLVLSIAAAQALIWYMQGRLGWDKTTHVGDHLDAGWPALSTPRLAAEA